MNLKMVKSGLVLACVALAPVSYTHLHLNYPK